MREFVTYVKDRDIQLAQELAEIVDDYINDKRRMM